MNDAKKQIDKEEEKKKVADPSTCILLHVDCPLDRRVNRLCLLRFLKGYMQLSTQRTSDVG